MARHKAAQGKARFATAALAAAGLALSIPAAGLAVVQSDVGAGTAQVLPYMPFTPANVDPQLARKVAAILGEDGLRFTPASRPALSKDRSVTVAVRVDRETARAISVRAAAESVGSDASRERVLAVAPNSYNLGIARGYQSFAQPTKREPVSLGLNDVAMPDLAAFAPPPEKPGKPSRFGSHLSLESKDSPGRAPRTFESAEQSVDLSTSYRVVGRLNVTAGVRLSKDNNRLAPLTDGVEDDQAVYVGTRLKF